MSDRSTEARDALATAETPEEVMAAAAHEAFASPGFVCPDHSMCIRGSRHELDVLARRGWVLARQQDAEDPCRRDIPALLRVAEAAALVIAMTDTFAYTERERRQLETAAKRDLRAALADMEALP